MAISAICLFVCVQLQSAKAEATAGQSEKTDFVNMDADTQIAHYLKTRQSLAKNPYRPLYHFSPPFAGIHDPAGLCWWKGKYHLFYLFSPPGYRWVRGHAVSDDLVHWQDLPILPATIRGGTGQVWVDKDRVILSTSGATVAVSSDPMLLNWTELSGKPRGDNFLWREGQYYYLVRSRHDVRTSQGRITALEILRSKDLSKWESMGNYLEDGYHTEPGTDCSCPNILSLGNSKDLILFFSHNQGPKYYIGISDLQKGRFRIEKHGRMNYGPAMRGSLHAPSGFVDPQGRCIGMWNIFKCMVNEDFAGTEGGVVSLPRKLSLNKKVTIEAKAKASQYPELNPLCIEPVEELKKLRFNPVTIDNMTIPANVENILTGVQGRAMELEVVIDPQKAREVGLRVFRSPDGLEQTTISLSMHAWAYPWKGLKRELIIDVSQASLDPEVASRSPEVGPLYLEEGELLRLRIFIDRSIVEVFANNRQCLTLRAYPSRQDSTGVSVFSRGSEAKLVSLNAYQMKSVWPELKDHEGR